MYEGWSNYSTFAINFWIDNTPEVYDRVMEKVQNGNDIPSLANWLAQFVKDNLPPEDLKKMRADLDFVNWEEIATELNWMY